MKSIWYAVQVRGGSERLMCEKTIRCLKHELYEECFVPMVEYLSKQDGSYKKTVRPMFQGYFFIITKNISEVYKQLQKTNDFIRVLREGDEFTPIAQEEADFIMGVTDEDYCVGASQGFIEGDRIVVVSGPLKGHEGRIRKIDRHKRRAKVEVSMMGTLVNVNMALEITEKL